MNKAESLRQNAITTAYVEFSSEAENYSIPGTCHGCNFNLKNTPLALLLRVCGGYKVTSYSLKLGKVYSSGCRLLAYDGHEL